MCDKFTYQLLEVSVAQLTQHVGFAKAQKSALEVTTDVLNNYLKNLLARIHSYAEVACRTDLMLTDVELAFKDFGVRVDLLKTYINDFGEVAPSIQVPKYPIQRENHLNFLRPGSCEVITRPLHIHEYLPPMYPELESSYLVPSQPGGVNITNTPRTNKIIKSTNTLVGNSQKKSTGKIRKQRPKKESLTGRPLRQLVSILMTRSGYLSSPYEGVRPEAPVLSIQENVCSDVTNIRTNLNEVHHLSNKTSCTKTSAELEAVALKKKMHKNIRSIMSGSLKIDERLNSIMGKSKQPDDKSLAIPSRFKSESQPVVSHTITSDHQPEEAVP